MIIAAAQTYVMAEVAAKFQCPVCQEVLKKPVAINGCSHK